MENQIHTLELCQRVSITASIKKMAQEDEMVEMNPTYCNTATLKVILCNGE